MTKFVLAAAFLALSIGAANADCAGHTVTAQSSTTATVASGTTTLPMTPAPATKTGG